MMVNDANETASGKLVLSLSSESGTELAKREIGFSVRALGQETYMIDLGIPATTGKCLLKAAAYTSKSAKPTLSQRRIFLVEKQRK